jgi:solute carrier family 13 (sodium-dependent dicarboxylate transporter), member 2/3/5
MPKIPIPSRKTVQWTGFFGGPALALIAYLLLPHAYRDGSGALVEFTHGGRVTCAAGIWMAVWWMTEALPIYVTALLPLCLFPVLGAVSIHDAAAPYANELIFLFMGGFVVALSMERWGLHKRIAFASLRIVGSKPRRVVLGFMMATAFISMWVSNTATAIMMLPIALSVIDVVLKQTNGRTLEETREFTDGPGDNFAVCLLLGVAYSASIGGIGTLIGTPPNLFLASYIETQLGREVSFVRWLAVGVPLVVVFLPLTWFLLTHVLYPIRLREIEGGASFIREAQRKLGPIAKGERTTLVVFALAALCWISRPLLVKVTFGGVAPLRGLSDPGIAMIAALALFVIPRDVKKREFVMDWQSAAKLPWGVLLLFGGGLSLAASVEKTGVGEFIGSRVAGMAGFPGIAMVLIVTTIVIFLTELTSNTATTATFVPILAAVAPALGVSPYMLIVPAAIAASCAFMLPAGTPPNALVFGSGYIHIAQMIRAGFWLNIIGIVLITALCYALVIPLFVR